ncbi:hypothetical protein BO71DRAFT_365724 [Aspergillus ellipticus CBS 707.79]|uniref:Fungal-type protein kinase domain-containing protein n=1 Tax=Aspergillus ellipticus CBS 707.79 TaxID=1448320 RepID=A0A319EB12_9EURO|nr:hypothetical protein BO71DRAFT_365724 [Aspergillus ellipticus CBS 707.79]
MNQASRTKTIKAKPIGAGLDAFRDVVTSTCHAAIRPFSVASLSQLDPEVLKDLCLDLVTTLLSLPASRSLPSVSRGKTLLGDLSTLNSTIDSNDFDVKNLIPLCVAVYTGEPDEVVWNKVYAALAETTPPPKSIHFLGQTPYLHTTSSFVNSSEQRRHVDAVLKEELGYIHIGVQAFYDSYLGVIDGLGETGAAVFRRCQEDRGPLFNSDGWRDWPRRASEREVLTWLSTIVTHLRDIAREEGFALPSQRTVLAQPDRSLEGSTADRKLDVGIVRHSDTTNQTYAWSDILVPGELKSNPKDDLASKTWRDLGRYAREVLTAQDTRRFALGFTLCGSNMRLWEFDRMGAIASSPFDINKDGLRFVSVILGFLMMSDEQLGYDPSIMSTPDGKKFIQITRNGQSEHIVLDGIMKRAPCVAGRATTCWRAHREGDETGWPLVVKDSWQHPEREEEGKLLHEITEKGVINVARYYHHETVQVKGKVDDIRDNVRRGLDLTQSANYKPTRTLSTTGEKADTTKSSHSTSSTGRKRSSNSVGTLLPPTKRTCSRSVSQGEYSSTSQNRVHRRVIIRDYGTAIYKARSRTSMLSALESCITGYESLHAKTGILQGDISTGNLILNEDETNPSWSAFLIDLDLAIKERRERPSGAMGKTGTRAFMAIGLLLGEKHSFMHDLESFFWVIFWICIHYDGPTAGRVVPRFEKWNYVAMEELAELKKGAVAHEGDFITMVTDHFTAFYRPLVPWVNRLRKVVFPNGGRWETESVVLYSRMKDVLRAACDDPVVSGHGASGETSA